MTRVAFTFAALLVGAAVSPALAESSQTHNRVVPIEQATRVSPPLVEGRQAAPIVDVSGNTRVERDIIERNLPKIGNGHR